MNKRQFLQFTASAYLSSVLSPLSSANEKSTDPKKVLVLGGTDFLGPVIVQELINRGHEVTLLNRGKTNPYLFPQLKRIQADRELENRQGMSSLIDSDEKWDWAIDTWQKSSLAVSEAAQLLKGRVGHIQYVSSVSVYHDWRQINITEDVALYPVPPIPTDFKTEQPYAIRKTQSELALQQVFGENYSTFRSHGLRGINRIAGYGEPYWHVKVMRGGPVVLPADAEYYQITDMVSLAQFMVHCGEKNHFGAFNVAYSPFKFRDFISGIKLLTGSDAQFKWLPQNFLLANDVNIWRTNRAGRYRFNVDRAFSHGLRNRSLDQLNVDQIKGYLERNPKDDFMFSQEQHSWVLSKNQEIELIKKWEDQRQNTKRLLDI